MDNMEKINILFENENSDSETYLIGETILDEPIQIKVKTRLSIGETAIFIEKFLDNVFTDDEKYLSYMFDAAFKLLYLQICTDFDVLMDETGEMINFEKNIFVADRLSNLIDKDALELYWVLYSMAEKAVQDKRNSISKINKILGIVENIVSKIDTLLDEVDLDKVSEYAEKISKMGDKFEGKELMDALIRYHSADAGDK